MAGPAAGSTRPACLVTGYGSRVDVVDFLLARIAEDEAVARAAQSVDFAALAGQLPDAVRAHVLAHSPDRVLADCENRRIGLDVFSAWRRTLERVRSNEDDEASAELVVTELLEVIHPMAGLYIDHPDWDPGWGALQHGLDGDPGAAPPA